MPTVIDSLIVTLGLDPSQFDEETKKAVAKVAKLKGDEQKDAEKRERTEREAARRRAKLYEDQNRKIADSFRGATNEIFAFGAAIIGAASIADFVKQTVQLDANIGRVAYNLGLSTEQLSVFESTVRQIGGTTQEADTSLHALTDTLQRYLLFGDVSKVPILNRLGLTMKDLQDPLAAMAKINQAIQGMDPKTANTLLAGLGIPQSVINLLEKTPSVYRAAIEASRAAYPVTKADADAAAEAQKNVSLLADAWRRVGNDILNYALPSLTSAARGLTSIAETDKGVHALVIDIGRLVASLDSVSGSAGGAGKAVGDAFSYMAMVADATIQTITHLLNAIAAATRGDWSTAGTEIVAAAQAAIRPETTFVTSGLARGDETAREHGEPVFGANAVSEMFGGGPVSAVLGDTSNVSAPVPGGASGASAGLGGVVGLAGRRAVGADGNRSLADRNANPGNIRGPGGGFIRFNDPGAGYAAMGRQLMRDFTVHGLHSIAAIINDPRWGWSNQWAKGNTAQSTGNYIARVSSALGVNPNAAINLTDPGTLQRLIVAMSAVERGGSLGAAAARYNRATGQGVTITIVNKSDKVTVSSTAASHVAQANNGLG